MTPTQRLFIFKQEAKEKQLPILELEHWVQAQMTFVSLLKSATYRDIETIVEGLAAIDVRLRKSLETLQKDYL